MKKAAGFGNERHAEGSPYLNRWVMVYPQGLSGCPCVQGRIKEVDGSYAIISPFYTTIPWVVDGQVSRKRVLSQKEFRVPLGNAAIEDTTEENLEKWVLLENKRLSMEDAKNSQETKSD